MKIYDYVRLVAHKKKFLDKGYDVGSTATIIEDKVDGYWLIQFDGEMVQDAKGVWYTTGEVMTALDEDLEVIPENN